MGKYERDWVEVAEQDVANELNGINVNQYSKSIANEIKKELEKNNIMFDKAVWSGGESYDDAGDVNILYKGKIIYGVELKFSHQGGKGTKANLGQNKFHEYIDEIIGYELFDEQLGLKKERYLAVEKYKNIKLRNKKHYEDSLREIKKTDKNFIKQIATITKSGAEEYTKYIEMMGNKNLDKINDLTEDIFNSKHVKESKSTKKVLYCIVQHYESSQQEVFFEDFQKLDTKVVKITSEGKSILFKNRFDKTILRFSVNWKNICQGGATPSFNVFA